MSAETLKQPNKIHDTPEQDTEVLDTATRHEAAQHVAQTQELPVENRHHQEEAVAVGGIRGAIDSVRLWRARRVVNKIERREAFYGDIADDVLGTAKYTEDKSGKKRRVYRGKDDKQRTKLRGPLARWMDFRIDHRSDKAWRKATYHYRAQKIYGPDAAEPVASVRHGLEQAIYDRLPGATSVPEFMLTNEHMPMNSVEDDNESNRTSSKKTRGSEGKSKSKKATKDNGVKQNQHHRLTKQSEKRDSIGHVVWQNTKRLIFGPKLGEGEKLETPLSIKLKSIAFLSNFAVGNYTASETRAKLAELGARTPKFGRYAHKTSRRQSRKANERLSLALEQPIASRYRRARKSYSQGVIDRIEGKRKAERERDSNSQKHTAHPKTRNHRRPQHAK